MKSNRNRVFFKNEPANEEKNLFAIAPILKNIIFIAVIVAAYWYIYSHFLLLDYLTAIYWTVNVLVTYNIIAGSARSLVMPILALITALVCGLASSQYNIPILSHAEFLQLIIVGIIGLLLTLYLKFK